LTRDMVLGASASFWQGDQDHGELYEKDVRVNQLERSIRKEIIAHLSGSTAPEEVPYSLLLMSLVKDLERLGDYAKNLAEAPDNAPGVIPDQGCGHDLREIRTQVEALQRQATEVFERSDTLSAAKLTQLGRDISKQCDELIARVVKTETSVPMAVRLTLGARYYKRIAGHLLNLVSAVIMPLHKLDFFDEDVLPPEAKAALRRRSGSRP
jgi:phosphate transport system protein